MKVQEAEVRPGVSYSNIANPESRVDRKVKRATARSIEGKVEKTSRRLLTEIVGSISG